MAALHYKGPGSVLSNPTRKGIKLGSTLHLTNSENALDFPPGLSPQPTPGPEVGALSRCLRDKPGRRGGRGLRAGRGVRAGRDPKVSAACGWAGPARPRGAARKPGVLGGPPGDRPVALWASRLPGRTALAGTLLPAGPRRAAAGILTASEPPARTASRLHSSGLTFAHFVEWIVTGRAEHYSVSHTRLRPYKGRPRSSPRNGMICELEALFLSTILLYH
ncbi:extracellular tyrosine-protein kinase PKDCC-like [Ochotona curzoniae]|uniref:extracellular tyrosine-protein kinase PKDCC-like n=1 Tax=Ochotona curzoniae TaxID=130825 RepID=UPI001B353AD7|nr:extracellular tyrosine-protein kinase PKDCC-like [Ochotona curzoniae]